MYLRKYSFTTEGFNRKILLLQDMGIVQYNQKQLNNEKTKSGCKPQETTKAEMVTLIHMSIGFYLLFLSFVLATIFLFVETIGKFKMKVTLTERKKEY